MTTISGGRGNMRHESKFSTWIRTGGHSTFVSALNSLAAPESKYSVVPDRLLDSIIDDALAEAVGRLNQYLQGNVSIDINAVDLTSIRDQLRSEVADRLTEIGVAVNPNDPVVTSIIARYAEVLNGFFQTEALHVDRYIWRSRDDSRVRSAHAEYDDHIFSWSDPPEGGHPGQGWNCRCTAEPIIDQASIPEGAVCDILTGDRLVPVFPDADSEKLAAIARELDLRVVSGQLDTQERLIHFLAQMRQEAGDDARLVENLNYNPAGLRDRYRYFRQNPDQSERYGRTADHPADPVAIANLGYGNRMGNGDADSGDGWTYRGRGLFQLTGRANYRAFTDWHERTFGEGIDFEADPDRAAEPVYAVRSAIFFWLSHNLPTPADQGLTETAVRKITLRINGSDATTGERMEKMTRIRDGGHFDGICRFSVERPRFEDAE
ncbi:MAG: phage minor head protein [Pseudorhodobacter sp.]|nr:phage minor head protein [Pseudorhodobacter sp.]